MNGIIIEKKFDPESLSDGLYVTAADTAAYPLFIAMKLVGRARISGIAFEPSGREIVTFNVGKTSKIEYKGGREVRHNVRMEISQRWLQNAILDYSDWPEKWWREVIQNSADARATKIHCYAYDNGNGKWDIGCKDNGSGMTLDILLDRFLVMGGTTKEGGDSTSGGFGKAKEMLILPWCGWLIHTRDNLAIGVGDSYSVYTAEGGNWVWHKLKGEGDKPDFEPPKSKAEKLNGTHLSVKMPADKHTTISAAMTFVEKCFLPKIEFEFDTNSPEDKKVNNVQADLRNGRTVEEIGDKARIHYTKASTLKPRILVRTREGLLMFEEGLPYEVSGYVVVELLKPSIQLLSSNRDSISDYDLRSKLREFVTNLTQNTQSALAEKKNKFVEIYKGEVFTARQQNEHEADLVASIGKLAEGSSAGKMEVEEKPKQMVGDILEEEYKRAEREARPGEMILKPGRETGETMLEGKFTGPNQIDAACKQLVWQPAYILYNELSDYRVPSKFRPASMTPTVMRLVKVWTELCRYVLVQLGCTREWGTGFGFSEHFRAAYTKREGIEWLVLNPMKNPDKQDEFYNPSNEADLKFLYAMAIHECTHLNDNAPNHEETFTIALTKNIALCADGYRKIKKIAGGVKLRGQAEFEKKKDAKKIGSATLSGWDGYLKWNERITYNMRGVLLENDSVAIWYMGGDPSSRTVADFIKALGGQNKAHVSFENNNGTMRFQFHDKEEAPPHWEAIVKRLVSENFDAAHIHPYTDMTVYNQYDDVLYTGPAVKFDHADQPLRGVSKPAGAAPRTLARPDQPLRGVSKPRKATLKHVGEVNIDSEITGAALGILTVDTNGNAHTIWQDDEGGKSNLDFTFATEYAVENGLGTEENGNYPRLDFMIRSSGRDKYSLWVWDKEKVAAPTQKADGYYELLEYLRKEPRVAIWLSGFLRALHDEYQRGLDTMVHVNGEVLWNGPGSDLGDAIGVALHEQKKN